MNIKKWLSENSLNLYFIVLCVIVMILAGVIVGLVKQQPQYTSHEESLVLKRDRAKCNLVDASQAYIDSVAPMSGLEAIVLIDKCIEHDIDICFVLAQGQKESHFGTQGLARKTNSVWNVFAYDGLDHDHICSKGKYKNANESIEPYLKLLKNRYLCDVTEYELLDNFTDIDGNRYASAPEYERDLRVIYEKIKSNTKIDIYSQEMKKYNMLLGR